jgi:hypothetical protein
VFRPRGEPTTVTVRKSGDLVVGTIALVFGATSLAPTVRFVRSTNEGARLRPFQPLIAAPVKVNPKKWDRRKKPGNFGSRRTAFKRAGRVPIPKPGPLKRPPDGVAESTALPDCSVADSSSRSPQTNRKASGSAGGCSLALIKRIHNRPRGFQSNA